MQRNTPGLARNDACTAQHATNKQCYELSRRIGTTWKLTRSCAQETSPYAKTLYGEDNHSRRFHDIVVVSHPPTESALCEQCSGKAMVACLSAGTNNAVGSTHAAPCISHSANGQFYRPHTRMVRIKCPEDGFHLAPVGTATACVCVWACRTTVPGLILASLARSAEG